MSIVHGHEEVLVTQTGFYGMPTRQVGRRPVGTWDEKRTRSGRVSLNWKGGRRGLGGV
jgi:hypothetical protein